MITMKVSAAAGLSPIITSLAAAAAALYGPLSGLFLQPVSCTALCRIDMHVIKSKVPVEIS